MPSDDALIRTFHQYDADQKEAQALVTRCAEVKAEIVNQLWLNEATRTQAQTADMLGISKQRANQYIEKVNPLVDVDG